MPRIAVKLDEARREGTLKTFGVRGISYGNLCVTTATCLGDFPLMRKDRKISFGHQGKREEEL